MFLEELFHDTIELGKKRFNGYLLILIFGVRVDDFFPKHPFFFLMPFLGATSSSSDSESVASSHVPFLGSCFFFFLAPPLAMKHMGGGGSGLSHVMAIPATSSSSSEESRSPT